MSKLLDSLRQMIQRQITERGIVVWYDPDRSYIHAVDRLNLADVAVLKYEDGYFRLRERLEEWLEWISEDGRPIADREVPPKLLVYVPKNRAESEFALIEIETAGVVIEPGAPIAERNTRLAGVVERVYARISPEKAGYVAGQVEEGLLNFEEVEGMAEEAGSKATGALKLIFGQAAPMEVLLLFAASDDRDAKIEKKNALPEIVELAGSETGLSAKSPSSTKELREQFVRHLLLGELAMAMPEAVREGAVAGVDLPEKEVQRDTLRQLCRTWRNRHDLQDSYAAAAEALESSLQLSVSGLPTSLIEDVETVPGIDHALLQHAAVALLDGSHRAAGGWAKKRRATFWPRRSPEILLQWSLVEVAADLLEKADVITKAVKKQKWALDELIGAYTSHAAPWMQLDTFARHLETRYARFDFEMDSGDPDWEKVMASCRLSYLSTLGLMAEAYSKALEIAGFESRVAPAQSLIFKEEVEPLSGAGKRAAYLLVDALRYEMAAELVDGLGGEFSVEMKPALGQLPGITPVGMAALMPGAEDGLALEKHGNRAHVALGGKRITDRASRMAWLQERTGNETLVMKLGEIIRLTPKKKKAIANAGLIVVTSQEIDRLGEGGSEEDEARIYMEDVLEKLRRGIRSLASAGFDNLVMSADHGFIFAEGFEPGWRMDPPGGDTAELHPRCWIGQGGSAAEGYFRVPASTLEIGGPLECAFPRGLGTFKVSGGAGAYFHGGASLQEQILPVVKLSRKTPDAGRSAPAKVVISFTKRAITNRFFSVTLALESEEMFQPEPKLVRVELLAGKEIVGHAAMAAYSFEEGTREVTIEPNQPNSVTMMLSAAPMPERVSLRVVDSKGEAPLALMKDIPVNLAL